MLHNFGVSLNYVKAYRSREKTLKLLWGDPIVIHEDTKRILYAPLNKSWFDRRLELDGHSRFKYCFMTLCASIRRCRHCRPVIVVDDTYVNKHHGGILFKACTQDSNNSIFILVFRIGDNENDKSWTWFFKQLKKAYGYMDVLCFVLDRHNSIKKAIEKVYLGTYHRICSYHLLPNLKSYFGKSSHGITQAFNSAVQAYTLAEFKFNMQQLDSMNLKIMGYLLMC